MNKKDLDALNELYLSVYDGEQLNEKDSALDARIRSDAESNVRLADIEKRGGIGGQFNRQLGRFFNQRQTGRTKASKDAAVKADTDDAAAEKRAKEAGDLAVYKGRGGDARFKRGLGNIDPKEGTGKGGPSDISRTPTRVPVPRTQPAGSGSTPPPRPAASSTVLAKQKGVEGKLDKATGKFTTGTFSAAEKSRYASVAAQNAAKSSAASGPPKPSSPTPAASAPKPPTPAIGKLGNTSFERRTPTSAELRAAQAERATQKASGQDTSSVKNAEKALQAAQKTNLPTTGPSPAIPDLKSVNTDLAKANSPAVINRPAPAGSALAKQQAQQKLKPPTPGTGIMQNQSYEWPSAKTIRDIADAYSSIYEAKKVDQNQDGDNNFADVRIARMIASGMSRAEAIAAVKNKEYNEEVEIDEATRMRKELGKEGEIATRQELARRSNAYQRSGSVDDTIAAAERGAKNPYVARGKNETEADYNKRKQGKSQTLTRLAANRRKSVRSGEGLRGYAANVEGSDRDLQSARGSARSAGTLTPREKKELNMEAYEAYEFVASYLLENNFAETLNDANVIIENMSDNWFESIMEDIRGASYTPNPIGNAIRAGAGLLKNTMNRPSVQGAIKTGSQMLQKSVPSGGYSTREGDGKPRETPLWDGPSKPTPTTPTTPTKPQTKKQPPMRDEPLW